MYPHDNGIFYYSWAIKMSTTWRPINEREMLIYHTKEQKKRSKRNVRACLQKISTSDAGMLSVCVWHSEVVSGAEVECKMIVKESTYSPHPSLTKWTRTHLIGTNQQPQQQQQHQQHQRLPQIPLTIYEGQSPILYTRKSIGYILHPPHPVTMRAVTNRLLPRKHLMTTLRSAQVWRPHGNIILHMSWYVVA